MSKSMNIAAAAALFSAIALGGAFAVDGYQPGDGDYYTGVNPPQVSQDTMSNGVVDMGRTGSIGSNSGSSNAGASNSGMTPEAEAGDMRYYEGASRDSE